MRKKKEFTRVLVQWVNMSEEESTWEDLSFIQTQFPEFFLEDKEILKEEGMSRSKKQERD